MCDMLHQRWRVSSSMKRQNVLASHTYGWIIRQWAICSCLFEVVLCPFVVPLCLLVDIFVSLGTFCVRCSFFVSLCAHLINFSKMLKHYRSLRTEALAQSPKCHFWKFNQTMVSPFSDSSMVTCGMRSGILALKCTTHKHPLTHRHTHPEAGKWLTYVCCGWVATTCLAPR